MDNQIRELSKRYKRRIALKRAVSLMCVVVLLFTMNTLKRNADTLERIPMCGLIEHTHTAQCYNAAGEQVCGLEAHVHTDACYQQRPTANGADDLGISIDGLVDADDLVVANQSQSLDLSVDLDQGDLLDSIGGAKSQDTAAVSDSDLLADDSLADDVAEINVANDAAEQKQDADVELGNESVAEDAQEQPIEKEEEQPAEDAQEQPVEKEEEQEEPAEDAQEESIEIEKEEEQEQSVEKEEEQPAQDEQEEAIEDAQEQSIEKEEKQEETTEDEQEQPAEEEEEQSSEDAQEEPADEEQDQPSEDEQEEPAAEEEEQPVEEEQEEPAEEEEEQPVEKEEEQGEPAEDAQEQSIEKEEKQEETAEEEEEQPSEDAQEEPAAEEEEQPVEEEQEQPAEDVQEQPVEIEDISEEAAEQEAEQDAEPQTEIAYPAQHFEQGTATVTVVVDAPEGAFPEGTVMVVEDVDDQKTLNNIEQSVTEDFVEVTSVHAVDISFWYGDTEIEPLLPISVVMGAVGSHARAQDPVVVHVDDRGKTEVVDSETTGAAEAALEMPATADPAAQAFEADSFSVYALVMTQVIETRYIDDSGETWTISVGYGKDAKLPEGATLKVKEVAGEDYLAEAEAALEDGKRITKARFFDIKIMDGNREVQPDDSVNVTVSLEGHAGEIEADEKQTDVGNPGVLAMHFVEANDEIVEVETRKATETSEGVTFAADGFSVWGVVYTVDFEYTTEEGEKITWSWPGKGSYKIADIMAEIGVTGEISDVSLVRTIDVGGAENVLYLSEDKSELISEAAFLDTFELTVVVDGKTYLLVITDDAINQGTTVNVYFMSDGGRTYDAETETGKHLTARVQMTDSDTDVVAGTYKYVKVEIDTLDEYVRLDGLYIDGVEGTLTFKSGTEYIDILYTYHKNEGGKPYIIYKLPAGATGTPELSFVTPNGITPDGHSVTLTPTLVDASGNPVTPRDNDVISQPAKGTWTAEYDWKDIRKSVSPSVAHLGKDDGGNTVLKDWPQYTYTAESMNRGEHGTLWTDTVVLEDTLTLPDGLTIGKSGPYTVVKKEASYVLQAGDGTTLFGLSNLSGLEIEGTDTSKPTYVNMWVSGNNQISYKIVAKNPKHDSNGTLTNEIENINYNGELNLSAINVSSDFVNAVNEGTEKKIENTVAVVETSVTNDKENSNDDAEIVIKPNEGYEVEKDSENGDDGTVKPGDLIDYTIRLTNTGDTPFPDDYVLKDTMPDTLTMSEEQKANTKVYIYDEDGNKTELTVANLIADGTLSFDQYNNNNITYKAGGLAANHTLEIVYYANVKAAEDLSQADGTVITNKVDYRDASSHTATTLQRQHVNVTKNRITVAGNEDNPINDGDIVGFKMKFENTKYNETVNVTMYDKLPPYLQLIAYDEAGTEITDLYTNNKYIDTWTTVKIKNDAVYDGNMRHADVKLDRNGNLTIRVNKGVGINTSSEYGYEVKFVAANVPESEIKDGLVTYTNEAYTPEGDKDTADVTGKVGKMSVGKAHDATGKLNGQDVQEPFKDGTQVDYTITVTNDKDNRYKTDFNLTDTLPTGMFPLVKIQGQDTVLTREQLNEEIAKNEAERPTFTVNGEVVKITKNNDAYTLTWVIQNPKTAGGTDYFDVEERTYTAQIDLAVANIPASGYMALENTATVPGDKAVDVTEVQEDGLESEKIAISSNPNLNLSDRMVTIKAGSEVVYELTLKNDTNRDILATGVKDRLPVWGGKNTLAQSGNYWSLGTNVFVLDEGNENEFGRHFASGDQSVVALYNGQLQWDNIKVPANTTLVQKVKVIYPDDLNLLSSSMFDESTPLNSLNRFFVDGLPEKDVDHNAFKDDKAFLQKSVIGFSRRLDPNGLKDDGTSKDGYDHHARNTNTYTGTSKDLFARGQVNEIVYSVIFANTGSSTLHLTEFKDTLPSYMTLLGIYASDGNQLNTKTDYTKELTNVGNVYMPNEYNFDYNKLDNSLGENVKVAFTDGKGNITFTINDGAGVDVAPRKSLFFYLRCKIDEDYEALENIDSITNSIQATVTGDIDIGKVKAEPKYFSATEQNNGDCEIVSKENGTTTFESEVTVHPVETAVPGIRKEAVEYKRYETSGSMSGYEENWEATSHFKNINSQSLVKWRITLYNDGTVDLNKGYTVTDYLPDAHKLIADSMHNYGDNKVGVISYKINGVEKYDASAPASCFTPTYEATERPTTYTFTFPAGDEYNIPAGSTAVLEIVSDFNKVDQFMGEIDNTAIFSPNQDWDANRVTHGQLEPNDDGTGYEGVSSSDYVNAYGAGATSSYKKIEAVDDDSSVAYGYDMSSGKNYIVVPKGTEKVKYTLVAYNLSDNPFKTFTIIDRMPDIGDTGVTNTSKKRNSDFDVSLASSDFTVTLIDNSNESNPVRHELTSDMFKIDFSTNTAFTTEDFAGTTTWDASYDEAESFRIQLLGDKIKGLSSYSDSHSSVCLPNAWSVEVTYTGAISKGALPGQTAWNTFGYSYTPENDSEALRAEPPKVGVRIQNQPSLQKIVLDETDQNAGVDNTVGFDFKVYEGAFTADNPPTGTPVWTTTVAQGTSVDLVRMERGGVFEEGKTYTVVESPKDGYYSVGYVVDGLKKSTDNYVTFVYHASDNITVVANNKQDESGYTPVAQKTLKTTNNRALTDKEFTFNLYSVDGTTETLIDTKQNATDGSVTFDKIDYDKAGTYVYHIKEVKPQDNPKAGILYDETVYELTVTVTEKNGKFVATGVYRKVGDTETTYDKAEFVNKESTDISVEKKWKGDVTSGEATMVLYQSTVAPTDTFKVKVQADLSGANPTKSAYINVTYSDGTTTSAPVQLNRQNDWTYEFILNRGTTYTFSYEADGSKVTGVAPENSNDVTDPTTIILDATAVDAQTYNVVFTLDDITDKDGNVNVTFTQNGASETIVLNKDKTSVTKSVTQEDTYSYTIAADEKFITTVTATNGLSNSVDSAAAGENVTITPTFAKTKMSVPVTLNWELDPNADTVVTAKLSGNGKEYTVDLSGDVTNHTWTGTFTDVDRLDADGNVITYTLSAKTEAEGTTITPVADTTSDVDGDGQGTAVSLSGTVERGMTLVFSCPGPANTYYANYGELFVTNAAGNSYVRKVDNGPNKSGNYWGSFDYLIEDLDVKDGDDNLYYGIYLNSSSTYNVETDATSANEANFKWMYGEGNGLIIWIKAKPGVIHFSAKHSDALHMEYGVSFTETANTLAAPARPVSLLSAGRPVQTTPTIRTLAASSSASSTKFIDSTVGGSGDKAFKVIQAKDLPAGATEVTTLPAGASVAAETGTTADVTGGGTVVITNDGTVKWSDLPKVDDDGNTIYYYVVEKDATAVADDMSVKYSYQYNTPGDPDSGIKKVIITNTTEKEQPQTGGLTITKAVTVNGGAVPADDNTIADGTYTFEITGPNSYKHTATITVTGGVAQGTIVLNDLPEGDYTIRETDSTNENDISLAADKTVHVAAGSEASANVAAFTNNLNATTSVKVTKVWTDNNDQDGIRPTSVQAQLKKDGANEGDPQTLNAGNGWTYTWSGLPKYNNGTAIDYTVDEVTVPNNYTKTVSTNKKSDGTFEYDIENTHTPNVKTVTLTKTWDDNGNVAGHRPTQAVFLSKVHLLADGKDVSTNYAGAEYRTVTDNNDNTWTVTWANLPEKAGGTAISYTVTEDADLSQYYTAGTMSNSGDSWSVTNTLKPGSLRVTKAVTIDGTAAADVDEALKGLADGTYYFNVYKTDGTTLATKADGTEIGEITIAVSNGEAQSAPVEVTDLAEGDYVVKENTAKSTNKAVKLVSADEAGKTVHVTASVTGESAALATLTNDYDLTEKTVVKTWGGSSTIPEGVEVEMTISASGTQTAITDLLANSAITGATVTLKAGEESKTWTNLPVYDSLGNPITYAVTETKVKTADGEWTNESTPTIAEVFTQTTTNSGTTTTIDNTQKTGTLNVTKELKYNGVLDNSEQTLTFYAAVYNGETKVGEIQPITVTNGTSSTATFTGLLAGVQYTVKEMTNSEENNGQPVDSGFGYNVSYENETFMLKADELTKTAKITNDKNEKGQINVDKTVKYNGDVDTTAGTTENPLTFDVAIFTKSGEDYTKVGETQTISVVAGETTQQAVFSNLDLDTTYYVFEMNGNERVDESFGEYNVVTGSGTEFTPTRTTKSTTVELVNEKTEDGSLTVTKHVQVDGTDSAVTEAKTFTVGLYEKDGDNWVAVTHEVSGEQVNWTANITVEAGNATRTATFSPLTVGKTYRVYELDGNNQIANNDLYSEYKVTYGDDAGQQVTRENLELTTTVTNNKETTTIKAIKDWAPATLLDDTSVEVTLSATVPSDTNDGDPVTVDISDLTTVAATQTITGDASCEWTNLPKYHNGKEVTYTVEETKVTIGGKEKWKKAVGTDNPYQTGVNTVNGETTFTNNYTSVNVQKRFQLNEMPISNWIDNYGEGTLPAYANAVVYFKLWNSDKGYYVDANGKEDATAFFTIAYGPGWKATGSYKDSDPNVTMEIKEGDTLHYVYNFDILPPGNYTPRECDKNGEHILTEDITGHYMVCTEQSANLVVMKNVVTNVTAAKQWKDGDYAVDKHPDVTFKLQKKVGDSNKWDDVSTLILSQVHTGGNYQWNAPGNATDGTPIAYPFVQWDNLPTWDFEAEAAIVYRTVEVNPGSISGYHTEDTSKLVGNDVVGPENGKHETYTNALDVIEIEVKKEWQPEAPAETEITLTLTGGGITKAIKLNGKTDVSMTYEVPEGWTAGTWEKIENLDENALESNAWHALWKNLPKYSYDANGVATKITYTITETGKTGYTIVYSDTDSTATSVVLVVDENNANKWTGTVKNVQETVDIEVNKAWRRGVDATWPEDVTEVVVKLQQSVDGAAATDVSPAKTAVINPTNWVLTQENVDKMEEGDAKTAAQAELDKRFIKGLPKYDNAGKLITYSVVETTPESGFTVSYNPAAGTTTGGLITVTNSKDIQTKEIKVKKVWQKVVGENTTVLTGDDLEGLTMNYKIMQKAWLDEGMATAARDDKEYGSARSLPTSDEPAAWEETVSDLPGQGTETFTTTDSGTGEKTSESKIVYYSYYVVEQASEYNEETTLQEANGTGDDEFVFTNQVTEIEITKIWYDVMNQPTKWINDEDKDLTFTLNRTSTDPVKSEDIITVTVNAKSETPIKLAGINSFDTSKIKTVFTKPTGEAYGQGYKIKLTNLPVSSTITDNTQEPPTGATYTWTYKMSESEPEGYTASYRESDRTTVKTGGVQSALNGEVIVNIPITYELPSTGGVGTGVVYGAGLAMILLAVLGLILRKRARDGI